MRNSWILGGWIAVAVGCGDSDARVVDAPVDAVDAVDAVSIDGPGSGIGDPCTTANPGEQGSCASGQICLTEEAGWGFGYCTAHCDPMPCPGDSVCSSEHICLVGCLRNADCREPFYMCSGSGACVPIRPPTLPPGTNHGQACVTPIVNPPGTGSLFNADVSISGPASSTSQLAVDPVTHHIVVAYMDVTTATQTRIGVITSTDDAATFLTPTDLPPDPTVDANSNQVDPVVAVDPSGNFYVVWMGLDLLGGRPDHMRIWGARSTNGGTSWQMFGISPIGEWNSQLVLDKPWVAASPVDGSLAVTWRRIDRMTSEQAIRHTRSTDLGATWSAPQTISDDTARTFVGRGLTHVTYGADGRAYVVWLEYSGDTYGSRLNQLYLQRLNADGTTSGSNVLVTGGQDSPTYDDPAIGAASSNVYVGFASGNLDGDWDIRMVASIDGGATFGPSVKVNDDARCATHFHPQLAIDGGGNVHAIWMDNRYLVGNVFHAVSPPAAAGTPLQFGVNTFVDDGSFAFTTGPELGPWISPYLGLVAAGNALYAVWTDTPASGAAHIQFAKGR